MKAVVRIFWALVTLALVASVIGATAWLSSPKLRLLVRDVIAQTGDSASPRVVPVVLSAKLVEPKSIVRIDAAVTQRRIAEVVDMFNGIEGAHHVREWISASTGLARELLDSKTLLEFGFDVSKGENEAAHPALVRIRFEFDWAAAAPKFDFDAWRTFELAAELAAASKQLGPKAVVSGYFRASTATAAAPYKRKLAPEARELLAEPLGGTGGVAVKTHVIAVPYLVMQS